MISSTSLTTTQMAKAELSGIWDVKVSDVRTMRYGGKMKRALMGRLSQNPKIGRRAAFKKAVVQLAEGDHIEFYEVG